MWRLSYSMPLWAKGVEQEIGWNLQRLFQLPRNAEIVFLPEKQIKELFEKIVKKVIAEQGWQPMLDAHEYSHHKGYYKENEANLLSALALSRSEDPYLRLIAFVEMYNYLYQDYLETMDRVLDQKIAAGEVSGWPEELKTREDLERRVQIYYELFGEEPEFSERVWQIYQAGDEIEQAIYDADPHPIDDMPAVDEAISETADTGWKVQGDILQENSYDGVTLLLLQYFYK